MEKRRKRIEEWRAERKKKAELLPVNFAPPSKKWTLEDDDEEDEEEPSQKLGENEEDALDAFMQVNYMHINLSVNWIIVMFINCFSFG
jgi:ATP-dependent RNA helicase DDX46/PRP5